MKKNIRGLPDVAEARDFILKNIGPCSPLINEVASRLFSERSVSVHLVSQYAGAIEVPFDEHAASRNTLAAIVPASNSDDLLIDLLNEKGWALFARDFALDQPHRSAESDADHFVYESEIFYRINPAQDNHDDMIRKLSIAKSWLFAAVATKGTSALSTCIDDSIIAGLVVGVHKLDSYLVVA